MVNKKSKTDPKIVIKLIIGFLNDKGVHVYVKGTPYWKIHYFDSKIISLIFGKETDPLFSLVSFLKRFRKILKLNLTFQYFNLIFIFESVRSRDF